MRQWMKLLEDTSEDVPEVLYHGTTLECWEDIQADNAFWAGGEHRGRIGISFTDDWSVAHRFATAYNPRHEGVIIEFDGVKIAQEFKLVPYEDPQTIHPESEWVIWDEEVIRDLSRFIIGAEKVSR